jgi:hypothetical protein
MAYSALVRRLLISCPGDVPARDLEIVHKAINRWNGVYGEAFGAVMIPISWGTHAAAEFGRPPQEILNKQLVDQSDICLALFANRLGTPTSEAESGTAEEIQRLSSTERYVGVLRSRRPIEMAHVGLEQAQRLEAYLAKLSNSALVLEYVSDDELSQRVDTILASAVSRDQGRADLQLQMASKPSAHVAEIWPRIDTHDRIVPDGTRRNWYLVLSNTGNSPARDVEIAMESSNSRGQDLPRVYVDEFDSEPRIEILAPRSETRFQLDFSEGFDYPQFNCTVSWMDDRGRQENTATLRLA